MTYADDQRERKAAKIVGYLRMLCPPMTADVAAAQTEDERAAICWRASVNTASEQTWAIVVAALRNLESPAMRLPDDPLDGLPKGPR